MSRVQRYKRSRLRVEYPKKLPLGFTHLTIRHAGPHADIFQTSEVLPTV